MVDEFSSFARMPSAVFRGTGHPRNRARSRHPVPDEPSREEIEFKIDTLKEPLIALCDRQLLTQAVTNLVKNASEAVDAYQNASGGAEGKGRVVIRASRGREPVRHRRDERQWLRIAERKPPPADRALRCRPAKRHGAWSGHGSEDPGAAWVACCNLPTLPRAKAIHMAPGSACPSRCRSVPTRQTKRSRAEWRGAEHGARPDGNAWEGGTEPWRLTF